MFVAWTLELVWGNDQSQAVKRASGVQIVPNWGEMVARIRARSSTDISSVLDRREREERGQEGTMKHRDRKDSGGGRR